MYNFLNYIETRDNEMKEEELINYLGNEVEIKLKSGKTLCGLCDSLTPASDNDSGIASILVTCKLGFLEIFENEIFSIRNKSKIR